MRAIVIIISRLSTQTFHGVFNKFVNFFIRPLFLEEIKKKQSHEEKVTFLTKFNRESSSSVPPNFLLSTLTIKLWRSS